VSIIHFTINNHSSFVQEYILENRFFNLVGRVSYGIYLYHWPFAVYFSKATSWMSTNHPALFFNNVYVLFIIRFSIVLFISYLSFELIEKRMLKLKMLFDYKKSALKINA
jgi:peptidoglycan/LPS O-acetylase OafA/YrhL